MPLGPLMFTTVRIEWSEHHKWEFGRGYSKKLSAHPTWIFDRLQAARLLHIYWTVLLELYMDILENAVLRSRLGTLDLPCGTAADSSNMVEPLPEVAMRE
ncbi:putative Zn(2)-C6 fungal-type domain-containing protein [Seiridium cardinale]